MSTALLPIIQTELSRYGLAIILILGIIGNTAIILVFRRQHQRSCAMYFIWASVINNIYLIFAIPPTLYSLTYGDLNGRSLIYCKLRFYLTNTLGQTARYIIMLACFDRYAMTTSYHIRFRFLTRSSTACYLMLSVGIIWHVIPIHIPIHTIIAQGRCTQIGLYYILHYVYIIVFACFIPILFMGVLGYLTYNNLRQLHKRIQPINQHAERTNTIRNRDRELLLMVFAEVLVHIVTMLLYPFVLLEISITTYIGLVKNTDRIRIENFLFNIASILFFISLGSRFYTFLVVSRAFRKDSKRYLIHVYERIVGRHDSTTQ